MSTRLLLANFGGSFPLGFMGEKKRKKWKYLFGKRKKHWKKLFVILAKIYMALDDNHTACRRLFSSSSFKKNFFKVITGRKKAPTKWYLPAFQDPDFFKHTTVIKLARESCILAASSWCYQTYFIQPWHGQARLCKRTPGGKCFFSLSKGLLGFGAWLVCLVLTFQIPSRLVKPCVSHTKANWPSSGWLFITGDLVPVRKSSD